jgi:hypothetical protein
MSSFFIQKCFAWSFSLLTVWLCNFLAKEYWRNVSEIDNCRRAFYEFGQVKLANVGLVLGSSHFDIAPAATKMTTVRDA